MLTELEMERQQLILTPILQNCSSDVTKDHYTPLQDTTPGSIHPAAAEEIEHQELGE